MDFKKLEFLSGLKVEDSKKESMLESLKGVAKMMSELDDIIVTDVGYALAKEPTSSREQDELYQREFLEGTHMSDGVFLAPKTIKK